MARLDYLNARLGARRGRILGAAGLRALLAAGSLEARVEALRERGAWAGFAPEPGRDLLAQVEAALREGWRREAAAAVDDVEGRRPRALLAAFLALGEATAVKALVRGVAQGLPPERTLAAAPPTPGLSEAALRAAASAAGIEGVVEALAASGSALAAPVREALPLPVGGGLLPLEIAVDRAALARAGRACSRRRSEDAALLRRHVEDLADARNAATLLALGGAPAGEDLFVEGGRRLDAGTFRRLLGAASAPLRAAIAALFRVGEGELASPWSADRSLERALATPIRREARRRPHSIAVPLAYLADRLGEVRRIAVVLRGAALGLDGAEILDLVEA